MTIKIVTDSSVQLLPEEIEKYHIHIAPLTIHQNERYFIDGQDITKADFLTKLQLATGDNFPTTSQPTVGSLVALYDELGADGSTVLSIHMTNLLSGTVEGAHTAAQQSQADVHVLDSKQVDRGLAFQVITAAQDVAAGRSLTEILAHLSEVSTQTDTVVYLDSLDALRRGGRISRMAGFVTHLIKLKVVFRLTPTKLDILHKGRGFKTYTKTLADIQAQLKGKHVSDFAISHVGASDERIEQIKHYFSEDHPEAHYMTDLTSPVLMTHLGLNAIGVFYRVTD